MVKGQGSLLNFLIFQAEFLETLHTRYKLIILVEKYDNFCKKILTIFERKLDSFCEKM